MNAVQLDPRLSW